MALVEMSTVEESVTALIVSVIPCLCVCVCVCLSLVCIHCQYAT